MTLPPRLAQPELRAGLLEQCLGADGLVVGESEEQGAGQHSESHPVLSLDSVERVERAHEHGFPSRLLGQSLSGGITVPAGGRVPLHRSRAYAPRDTKVDSRRVANFTERSPRTKSEESFGASCARDARRTASFLPEVASPERLSPSAPIRSGSRWERTESPSGDGWAPAVAETATAVVAGAPIPGATPSRACWFAALSGSAHECRGSSKSLGSVRGRSLVRRVG